MASKLEIDIEFIIQQNYSFINRILIHYRSIISVQV